MLFINLRQALRNLRRNKTYTFVNLIGLGLACSFVILVLHLLSTWNYSIPVSSPRCWASLYC